MDRQRLCLAEPVADLYFEFGLKGAIRQKIVLLDVRWDMQGWSILLKLVANIGCYFMNV